MIDQGLLEEPTPATKSPFAAVIAEYKRHAAKIARKPWASEKLRVQLNRTSAAFYYKKWETDLETR